LLLELFARVDLLLSNDGLLRREVPRFGSTAFGGSKDNVRSMAGVRIGGTGTVWLGTFDESFTDRTATHRRRMSQMVSEIGS
jgi:hypothetical protein